VVLERRQLLAVDVLNYHNDLGRTGQNLDETFLTTINVRAATFGKLGQVAVDGQVYTQPLVKTHVNVPGLGLRDLVFVATEHDSVYAFDAYSLQPIWQDSLIDPANGTTPVPEEDVGDASITPELGITGTPVIDPESSTLYVVARTKTVQGDQVGYAQTLHALDLATGQEKAGGPVTIQATVPGTGDGSVGGQVSFDPLRQNQRSGLLLSNGVVYAAFASIGDIDPYHGWVLGYDAHTLAQVAVFNTTPNGSEGGIWMSGGAPAADAAGNIFLSVGNGTFDTAGTPTDLGNAVLKLTPKNGQLVVSDYFVPSNQQHLADGDLDQGSGGVMLLPDQDNGPKHLLVTGGKIGAFFLINRDKMGGFSAKGDRVVQTVYAFSHELFSTPAYFDGKVYVGGSHEIMNELVPLQALTLKDGRLSNGATSTAKVLQSWPGSTPSVSASGKKNGIVWVLDTGTFGAGGPAILRAFDAHNLADELYDSNQASSRDTGGPGVKFSVPTVANGHVYVSGNGTLTVYGLFPSASVVVTGPHKPVHKPTPKPPAHKPTTHKPTTHKPTTTKHTTHKPTHKPPTHKPVKAKHSSGPSGR
jgi:hypothetical protein